MKVALIGAALAAATVAQAGLGDYVKAGSRQLGKRLNSDPAVAETDCPDHPVHRLEARHDKALSASSSKSAAKARSSSSAAAVKSKAAASSRSKSLASKSKSLASKSSSLASLSKSLAIKAAASASKAASIASREASCSSEAAASSVSAAQASSSLAAQQSRAAAQASSLSSLASANSVAAESIVLAQKSLSAAQASVTAAAQALSKSVEGATASAGQAASDAKEARSSLSSARASLADEAATLTAQAKAVSLSSVAVASSAAVVSANSVVLDKAASSLSSDVDSVQASLGSISSSLSLQSVALAGSSSALADVVKSIALVQSEQSVAALALAASSAEIASKTSSLAAAATASGLATACLLPKFLGNGNCYSECPAANPVQFTRDHIYGLCCAPNAKECLNADPTAITVCAEGYLHTVLDERTQGGTCTTTCCTVEDGVAYEFRQLEGSYEQCVKAQDCVNGLATADPESGLCCEEGIASCKDQTATGALSCTEGSFFTANPKATDKTGTCSSSCAKDTFYSAAEGANECLVQCPVKTAFYAGESGGQHCCAAPGAKTCSSAQVATSCVAGSTLTSDGQCVAKGGCPNGAADSDGVCCPAGALSCSSALVATSCGMDRSLAKPAQTYLTPDGKCVAESGCSRKVGSVLDGGQGVCCADEGALSCASTEPGAAASCDNSASYFLKPSSPSSRTGTCVKNCAGSSLDPATNQCVDSCPSGSSFADQSTGYKTCCLVGVEECDANGDAVSCSAKAGSYLQPDGKSCKTTCPEESVKAASGRLCCAEGTSDCSSVALTGAALSCTSKYRMFEQTCLAVCGPKTVETTLDGARTCRCYEKHVAKCTLTGRAYECDKGYSLWDDGKALPSCEKTCAPNTEFDYTKARGTCKCTLTAQNHVQTCDIPTGYPTTCVNSYSVFTPDDRAVAPTCQPSCVPGTEFDTAKAPGTCKCSTNDSNHVAACNLSNGHPIACRDSFALFTPSNSAVAPTCQASCHSGYVFDLAQAPGTCKCASANALACDANGVPTQCPPGMSPFIPAVASIAPSCETTCPFGFQYDLTDTSASGSCQQCYNINNFSGNLQVYLHFATVAQCRVNCAGYDGYLTAWHSGYADYEKVHCTCFNGRLTSANAFGTPADRKYCNKYDPQGALSGGEYFNYITVRMV